MITPATIEQIKNKLDIIDVVGEFVKLKKRGSNYIGNCPFHNEKTPSFTVSAAKELYKCFGCGKSGNTITFVMEHEKLSYVEALRWLATRYNIEIEEAALSAEQKQQFEIADSLYIINNFAAKFLQTQLVESADGKAIAQTYLQERGFTNEVLLKFNIGYNPAEKNVLTNALLQNQFNKELLLKTGLVVARNEQEWVDNYRNRIIFPIHGNTGKIIGFGARVIGKADKAPKYINTPENDVYVKSKILYGLYFARLAIDKFDECLLVEGYTDVVSLHQAGIENVVASGGTSLTIDQLRLIKKYTSNLTIIYDGDNAGIKAALRGLDMALEEGLNVKLVLIPDGEDPDSYVKKVGEIAFRNFVGDNKKDFIIFQLQVMLSDAANDVVKKNTVVNQIADTLSKINKAEDFLKQQEYIKQCSQILKIDEGGLVSLVNKYKRDKLDKELKKQNNTTIPPAITGIEQPEDVIEASGLLTDVDEKQELNVLRVLVEHGLHVYNKEFSTIADFIFKELEGFHFENPLFDSIITEYKVQYSQGLQPTTKYFLYHNNAAIREIVVAATIVKHDLSPNWDNLYIGRKITQEDNAIADAFISMQYYKLRKIKKMIAENQTDMETVGLDEQMQLIVIHQHLKAEEKRITESLGTVIFR
jgi:DNA primase